MGDAELIQPAQPSTDDGQVQAAIRRLEELENVDIDGSLKVYEDIHRSLSSALDGSTEMQRAAQ